MESVRKEVRVAAGRAGYTEEGVPPLQYRVSVDVSFGSSGSTANPAMGAHLDAVMYNLNLQADGTWVTAQFNGNHYAGGKTGQRPRAASYTLGITAQGSYVTYFVSGT